MAMQTGRESRAWFAICRRCDACGRKFKDGKYIQVGLDRNYCTGCEIPETDRSSNERDRFWPRRVCGVFEKPWGPDIECPAP